MGTHHEVHDDGHSHADEELTSLAAVQALVLERCPPLGRVETDVTGSFGHVLAEDAVVSQAIPPFPNTAMDGYAVRAGDAAEPGSVLEVVGVLPAGAAPPAEPLRPGEAIQIMTGAPMPPGADSVAIVERTEALSGNTVRILDPVRPGANIRAAGSDFEAGTVALGAGTELGPAQVGILASIGLSRVQVWRKPRVGVMSTGDELVQIGEPLGPGQIWDSNRLTLLSFVARDGYEAVDLGPVSDSAGAVQAALREALGSCDVVLSSGGVSKGEFDFVKTVLDSMASESDEGQSFELQVAIRPAKPLAMAWLPRPGGDGRVAFFGLPGNPVSAIVSYEVVALPAIRRLAGHTQPIPAPVPAIAGEDFHAGRDQRTQLVRVRARFSDDGRLVAVKAGGQQSHQLSGMASANALAVVPPGRDVAIGGLLQLLVFDRLG